MKKTILLAVAAIAVTACSTSESTVSNSHKSPSKSYGPGGRIIYHEYKEDQTESIAFEETLAEPAAPSSSIESAELSVVSTSDKIESENTNSNRTSPFLEAIKRRALYMANDFRGHVEDDDASAAPNSKSAGTMAIIGFILSILGWFVPFLGFLLLLAGGILCILGLNSKYRGLAVAGIILSGFGLIWMILLTIIILGVA